MLESLTAEHFKKYIGKIFTLNDESVTIKVELIKVEASEKKYDEATRDPFSLEVRGSKDVVLPQKMYTFIGEGFEGMEIFFVPVGPDKEGMVYQAIFS